MIRLSLAPIVGFPTSIPPPQTGQSLIISFAFASVVAWTQKTKLMTLMSQAAASVFMLTTPTAEIPEWVPMQTPLIFRHHFEEYTPLSLIPLRINHQFSQSLFPLTTPLGASLALLQALKGNNAPVQEVIGDPITPVVDTSSVSVAFIPVPLNPKKMGMAELFDYCPLFIERSAYKFSSGSPEALLKPKPFLEPPPEFSPLPPPPPSGGGNMPHSANAGEGSLGSPNDTTTFNPIPQSHSILPPTGSSALVNSSSAEMADLFDYRPSFVERASPPATPKIKLKPLLDDFSPLPSLPPSGNDNTPPSAKLGPLNDPAAPLNPIPRSGSATFPPTDPSPVVNTSSTEEDSDLFSSRKNSPFSSPVPTSRRVAPLADEDSDIDDDPLMLPPGGGATSLPLKASPKGKTVLELLVLER